MKSNNTKLILTHFIIIYCLNSILPVLAFQYKAKPKESSTDEEIAGKANSQSLPRQILKTGVNLRSKTIAANTKQLADIIHVTPLLSKIEELRNNSPSNEITLENLAKKQMLFDTIQKAIVIVTKTNFEIDFTLAEIGAERNVYGEILNTFTADRDKMVARSNAMSFYSNGALWAVGEAFDIPTNKYPNLSVPSGILGIIAGLAPSAFSLYAMHQYNGKKKTSEVEPNMLAKLFGYKTNPTIEYPDSVWTFLNSKQANKDAKLSRKDVLINRWVSDSNIASFTDKNSAKQLDAITASVAQKKGLTIATLTARQEMLQQLAAEIYKMKRMLLEITMVINDEKALINSD